MTVIGPLTSNFQAPSSCTASGPHIYQIWTGKESRYEQGPLFTKGSNCFPSSYDISPQQYYSPGICPQGYTAACTRANPIQSTGTETALICCPTALSYSCLGSTDAATLGCTAKLQNAAVVIGVTVISDGVTGSFTAVTETNPALAAHSIQVRFKEGDAVAKQTAGAVTSQTSSSLSTAPASTSSLPPETGLPTPTSGVSTATAVGIGIGSALGAVVLASVIGLFFFLRWRRKRKAKRGPTVPPKDLNRGSTYRGSTYTRNTDIVLSPPFELSEDVSFRYLQPQTPDPHESTKPSPTLAPVRRSTAETWRTARTVRTTASELEDTASFFPHAAELEVPTPELEAPMDGSIRSAKSMRPTNLGADSRGDPFVDGRRSLAVDSREAHGVRQGGERETRLLTPVSQSSSAWTIMRKDAAVATPWL